MPLFSLIRQVRVKVMEIRFNIRQDGLPSRRLGDENRAVQRGVPETAGKTQSFPNQTFESVSFRRIPHPFRDGYHDPCKSLFLWKIPKFQESTGFESTLMKQAVDRFLTVEPVFLGESVFLRLPVKHSTFSCLCVFVG
jgi:hypothetical protein